MRSLRFLAITGLALQILMLGQTAVAQESPGLTAAQAATAKALIQSRCTVCHASDSLRRFVERCAERRGAAYLEQFLTRHHAPEPEVRAAIIAYLTCPPDALPPQ